MQARSASDAEAEQRTYPDPAEPVPDIFRGQPSQRFLSQINFLENFLGLYFIRWNIGLGKEQKGMPNEDLRDYGPVPIVVDIEEAAKKNDTFRTALWTGSHLQLTLMSIKVGDDIGVEMHPDVDQFIRIEDGEGLVKLGPGRNDLNFQKRVDSDDAIVIPAGTWHNLINTGNEPLKVYSIYAPPQHPWGTVHRTKADAMAAE